MPPRALLLSSDQETSRRVTQALQELELHVDICTEIFHAVEKLTSGKFEVVIADFDAGLEANFLLTTSSELKSSGSPCLVGITKDKDEGSVNAARRMGAIILAKPIVPEQAKYLLLNSDEFLRRMSTWMPQSAPPLQVPEIPKPPISSTPKTPTVEPELCRVDSPDLLSIQSVPERLPFSSRYFLGDSEIQTLFQTPRRRSASNRRTTSWRSTVSVVAFIAFFLLSVGYIFSEPLRTEAVKTSVARICRRAVQSTKTWLQRTSPAAEPIQQQAKAGESAPFTFDALPIIHVAHSRRSTSVDTTFREEPQAEAQSLAVPQQNEPVQLGLNLQIPDSLHSPLQIAAVPGVEPRVSSALLGPVEPLEIPEQLSKELLLQKVSPRYPEQARKTGLQGPVVLQALIGRDGRIENLKLVDGYLVLGQAAYNAVRQWQFKPYMLNGHAVATQTYITINFQLPTYSSLSTEDPSAKEGSR